MAREKVDNKLNVVIGTKAQIEGDASIPENSIIVVTDEELKADEIVYNVEKTVKEVIENLEITVGDLEAGKVDKVEGKGLSTNDYTSTEKNKLAGIASGAEVNVQSDWNATSGDAFIKNKPTTFNPSAHTHSISNITNLQSTLNNKLETETDPIFTAWNKSTGISITKSQVSDLIEATQSLSGLMSATDKQRLDVLHALLEEDTENNVVDSINEVLAIFNNYPEGADLVTALAGKVDKVTGKGLSTNDYTDVDKQNVEKIPTIEQDIVDLEEDVTQLESGKQDKLTAGDNITIDPDTNVISASGGSDFHRVRIFSDNNKLVTTQTLYEGEKVLPLDKLKNGYLFDYGTRNEFDYNTIITEDLDLTYSIIPTRYVQTTVEDFDESGDYTGTEEYIILPADKPDGYRIFNSNVKGVATNGDYLTDTSGMFYGNSSSSLELDYLDTSNVTDMSYMFSDSQATELDLSSFDTSNVVNMRDMFSISSATTFDLSSFDTSNVTNMQGMFAVSQATTLDLSSFDTSNVTNMNNMFIESQATTGYARTQTDADNFNNSSNKPAALIFEVKEDIYTRVDTLETNKQDKLVAGDNITIDNNVISATGGSGGYEPDMYTIVINQEDKLKVSKDLEIDGGFL